MADNKPRRRRSKDSPWFSPQEAADYLGISVDLIYDACAKKGLKHSKISHNVVRLHRDWLDAWAETFARENIA